MKKAFGIITLLVIALIVTAWIGWIAKAELAAHFISNHLRVPVSIQTLDLTQNQIDISSLWVGTPSRSKTSTSFSAETIEVDTELKQILDNPLIIDRIDIANIFVGLEYYENGSTNWTYMLGDTSSNADKKKGRDYLIRTLILENLTVEVTQANGQKKRYPTIDRMEFHNISSDTGFPIKEIEKAIFNLMMKDIMDKFNLFKPLNNLPGKNPLKYLPGLFNTAPLFFRWYSR